jgi:hypothetical protein
MIRRRITYIPQDQTNIDPNPKTKAEILAITDAQTYDGYYCSELNNKLFYWIDEDWFPSRAELES